MTWSLELISDAHKDFAQLDGSQRKLVRKALGRLQQNPLPLQEGGYGKPLGKKGERNLTGFLKLKLKGAGLRIVYKLVRSGDQVTVIVIGAREDEEVYDIAWQRIQQYGL